jgi:type VI secretion system secreted protein Hcp
MSECFISIKGLKQGQFKGDQPDRIGRADWMMGTAFTQELSQPRDEHTGLPTGKRQWKPIQFTKQWGAASPQILQALATNETLNPVIFEFTRTTPDGKEQVYQTITLTNATIVNVSRTLGADEPQQIHGNEIEVVELTFQKITMQDTAGGTMFTDDFAASS